MQFPSIVAKDNKLIKLVLSLAQDLSMRKHLSQAVIYGEHCLVEASKQQVIEQIFVLETAIQDYLPIITQNLHDKIILLSAPAMAKINILDSKLRIAALVRVSYLNAQDGVHGGDSLWLERIQDPGNLGTILRAASAAAVKQVYISAGSVDVYNPKVLRAAQGIQFGLDIRTDCNLLELATNYQGQLLAFSPHVTTSVYAQDLRVPTALIFGNEGSGISPELLAQIDSSVSIPMPGTAESLNLAMAATVALFELARQRIIGYL